MTQEPDVRKWAQMNSDHDTGCTSKDTEIIYKGMTIEGII